MDGDQPIGYRRWQVNGVEIVEETREVVWNGHAERLQDMPFSLLVFLLERPGKLLKKDELKEAIWGTGHVSDSAVRTVITKVRAALRDDDETILLTIRGTGIQLEAPVEQLEKSSLANAILELDVGQSPPGFPNWRLIERVSTVGPCVTWRCEQQQTGARLSMKLTGESRLVPALRREVEVSKELIQKVGARDELLLILDENLVRAPYFVAHHDVGLPLARWIERRGGFETLSLAVRVDIVRQVAEALALAHAQFILHGNLGPEYIYVEELGSDRWRVRVAGFGSTGGAPEGRVYQAPELVTGRAPTVSSDVYALGVLLFNLVSTRLDEPVASGWETQIDDEILRDDIAACTNGRVERRLAAALDLVERLRTLEDRRAAQREHRAALEAKEKWERARQRRPWQYTLVGVTFVAFVSLSFVIARSVSQQRATRELNEYISNNVDMLDNPVFWVGAPAVNFKASPLRSYPVGQSMLALDLDQARSSARSLGPTDARSLQAQADVIRDLLQMGRTQEAQQRLEALKPTLKGRRLEPGGAVALSLDYDQALLDRGLGHFDQAATEFQDLASRSGSGIEALGADFPLRVKFHLDESLCAAQRFGDAEKVERELVTDSARLHGEGGLVATVALTRLAATLVMEHQYDEAQNVLQKADEFLNKQWREDDSATIDTRNTLADLYARQGRWDDAIRLRRQVMESVQRLAGDRSEYAVRATTLLARDLLHAGRKPEALQLAVQATEVVTNSLSGKSAGSLAARATLSQALFTIGDPPHGAPIVDDLMKISGNETPNDVSFEGLVDYLESLRLRGEGRDLEQARSLAQRAVNIFRSEFGNDDPDTRDFQSYLQSFPK